MYPTAMMLQAATTIETSRKSGRSTSISSLEINWTVANANTELGIAIIRVARDLVRITTRSGVRETIV